MAVLFASLAIKRALDTLTSFLPASLAASSSSSAARVRQEHDLEDLRMLERTMHRIHATLHDAEQHWNIREETTKLRLKELKDLAYDMEDVVDEYEYEVNRCKIETLELFASSASGHKRKHQLENEASFHDSGMVAVPDELVVQTRKLIERFHEIKYYSDNFTLSENDGDRLTAPALSTLRKTSSVVYAPSILGREKDKNSIVDKLCLRGSDSITSSVSVLAIVGMGGLGKTTLAQLVYNDSRMQRSFDMHAWVCVSEQFDVSDITKSIMSSLQKRSCDLSELGILQEALVNEIKGKRVLLIFDDVWNERRDLWELLCMPMWSTKLCKIIVTTRSENVARMVQTVPNFYSLNCLNSEDSWSLFKQVAFANQESVTPANLVEIGRSIVRKCKGLPLAIRTVGSMLRCGADETTWRNVLECELWDLEQPRNEILPSLELSYKHMPFYLKRCFIALSLFQKDRRLDRDSVIKVWRLLDLLQSDGNDDEDGIGSLYINALVHRSILQYDSNKYVSNKYFIMHDLVHDLACFLAGEDFLRLESGTLTEIPPNTRHLSVCDDYFRTNNGEDHFRTNNETLVAPHSLRSFIVIPMVCHYVKNLEALFVKCKKLRSLGLEYSSSWAFPDFIGSMKLLRHLSGHIDSNVLSTCIIMPQVYNLRTLDFRYLPACGFRKLINLRSLEIYISTSEYSCNIGELRSLNEVRKLSIFELNNVAHIEDTSKAQLHKKKHLESLCLWFSYSVSKNFRPTSVSHEQVLDSLRPHYNLRELIIRMYNCPQYPSWLGNASFSKMTKIKLDSSLCQNLPTLGELPSLRLLDIHSMDNVQYIGREFCSNVPRVKGFPSLTTLIFRCMPKCYEWSGMVDGDFSCLQSLQVIQFTKLRSIPSVLSLSLTTLLLRFCDRLPTIPVLHNLNELVINKCDGLTKLPDLPSLLKLEIETCPNLSEVGSFPSLTTLSLHNTPLKDEVLHNLLNDHPLLNCITIMCATITNLSLEPQRLSSLRKLRLCCANLQYCDGLAGLTFLEEIKIWGCPKLSTHSLLPRQLESLDVRETKDTFRLLYLKNSTPYVVHL